MDSSAVDRVCGACGASIKPYDVAMWRGSGGPPYHAACFPGTLDATLALRKRVESLEARVAHIEAHSTTLGDAE